jgi:putative aldouronate transport system permease protein
MIASINSTWKAVKKNAGYYLLLLPAVILLCCFTYKPMYGVIIAFKNYRPSLGIADSPWVYFKHFEMFFKSYQFTTTITNTLIISFYSIAVTFPLPIMFALLINQLKANRFRKAMQTITYMPHFISTVVLVGVMLLILSPGSGLIGNIYKLFGAAAPNLIGKPAAFSSIYVWSDVWQNTGWDSIIYLAALSTIDAALYEAAVMDGAGKWQKIIHIDIPMIVPTACILLILKAGNIMNIGFEKVYLMQNSLNLLSSEVIATYVYKVGIINSQYSLSSAVNLFNNIINLVFLLAVNQVSKKLSSNSLL